MAHRASLMQETMCEIHTGARPGGGVCAICLQEKLFQLWRGEGKSAWDKEEFPITPPAQETMEMPPVCEPSQQPGLYSHKEVIRCFPPFFRSVRNIHREEVKELSKGVERDKINESGRYGKTWLDDDDGGRVHPFSCEIKSMVKEFATLHDKRRTEKAKRRSGSENVTTLLVPVPPKDKSIQESVYFPSVVKDADAGPSNTMFRGAGPPPHGDREEDTRRAFYCFHALWPDYKRGKLNLKWAKALASPALTSNKIAPSKSDLTAKASQSRLKVTLEESRENRSWSCEHAGAFLGDLRERVSPEDQISGGLDTTRLHPQLDVQREEYGTATALDKETEMRMEASRIAVLAWLQSLPSPKTAVFKVRNDETVVLSDNISLDNGVIEMCDEEEVELTRHAQTVSVGVDESDVNESFGFFNQMNSFRKFLLSAPRQHMEFVEVAMTAQ